MQILYFSFAIVPYDTYNTCTKTFYIRTGVTCTYNITISAIRRTICIIYITYVAKVEHNL